jgi:hypothetical protein
MMPTGAAEDDSAPEDRITDRYHSKSSCTDIGGSAAVGDIGLATVLVIGFALHNGTEGFGIVAPLAAEGDRSS